jgi:hypothetical protein
MKNIFKKVVAVMAICTTISSCTPEEEKITGTGNLELKFDNAFKTNDLLLNTQTNISSNNEVLKISKLKYIISNIVLTKEDGTTLTYPKSESYFIIDEATPTSLTAELENIPAGNYTKVQFGIGVDKAQWELGATGQGDLLTNAQEAGMMWSWTAGYKFVNFEGTFTSSTVTTDTEFKIHNGQSGSNYNYAEVTIDLPSKALVRTNTTPEIHLVADVSKIIDGTNKIKLSEGATIMGGAKLPLITTNLSEMFSIDHVHND